MSGYMVMVSNGLEGMRQWSWYQIGGCSINNRDLFGRCLVQISVRTLCFQLRFLQYSTFCGQMAQ